MILSGIQDRALPLHVADAIHVLDPRQQRAGMTEEVTAHKALVMTQNPSHCDDCSSLALAMTLLPEVVVGRNRNSSDGFSS
jgi:hypothetical protein